MPLVRATQTGFYIGRRRPGDEFTIPGEAFNPSWMERVAAPSATEPEATEPEATEPEGEDLTGPDPEAKAPAKGKNGGKGNGKGK